MNSKGNRDMGNRRSNQPASAPVTPKNATNTGRTGAAHAGNVKSSRKPGNTGSGFGYDIELYLSKNRGPQMTSATKDVTEEAEKSDTPKVKAGSDPKLSTSLIDTDKPNKLVVNVDDAKAQASTSAAHPGHTTRVEISATQTSSPKSRQPTSHEGFADPAPFTASPATPLMTALQDPAQAPGSNRAQGTVPPVNSPEYAAHKDLIGPFQYDACNSPQSHTDSIDHRGINALSSANAFDTLNELAGPHTKAVGSTGAAFRPLHDVLKDQFAHPTTAFEKILDESVTKTPSNSLSAIMFNKNGSLKHPNNIITAPDFGRDLSNILKSWTASHFDELFTASGHDMKSVGSDYVVPESAIILRRILADLETALSQGFVPGQSKATGSSSANPANYSWPESNIDLAAPENQMTASTILPEDSDSTSLDVLYRHCPQNSVSTVSGEATIMNSFNGDWSSNYNPESQTPEDHKNPQTGDMSIDEAGGVGKSRMGVFNLSTPDRPPSANSFVAGSDHIDVVPHCGFDISHESNDFIFPANIGHSPHPHADFALHEVIDGSSDVPLFYAADTIVMPAKDEKPAVTKAPYSGLLYPHVFRMMRNRWPTSDDELIIFSNFWGATNE